MFDESNLDMSAVEGDEEEELRMRKVVEDLVYYLRHNSRLRARFKEALEIA